MSSAILTIGKLTEDAQKARNKVFTRFREHHFRKSTRTKSSEGILNIFLISSDPLVTRKRQLSKKKECHQLQDDDKEEDVEE